MSEETDTYAEKERQESVSDAFEAGQREKWQCTYCNEFNTQPPEYDHPGQGVGIEDCSRCGTRRSR